MMSSRRSLSRGPVMTLTLDRALQCSTAADVSGEYSRPSDGDGVGANGAGMFLIVTTSDWPERVRICETEYDGPIGRRPAASPASRKSRVGPSSGPKSSSPSRLKPLTLGRVLAVSAY